MLVLVLTSFYVCFPHFLFICVFVGRPCGLACWLLVSGVPGHSSGNASLFFRKEKVFNVFLLSLYLARSLRRARAGVHG